MVKFSLAILLTAAVAAQCGSKPPADPGYDCGAQPTNTGVVSVANAISGKYIVVLKDRPPQGLVQTYDVGVTNVKVLDSGYAATIAKSALSRVLANPNVAYIQEDGVKSVNPKPAATTDLWGLDRIDQRTLPLLGDYSPTGSGFGVNVAVVDTGISPHEDFADRLSPQFFTAYGSTARDGHGHGTHVAGTIAGTVYGVAKASTLYAVKVLDDNGSGSDSSVIRGIEWVIARKKADPSKDWVFNASLGGGESPALDQVVCDAIAAGVTPVMAAGNEGADADTSSPGRVRDGITVAASDRYDTSPSWSNFGSLIDLYAPGVDIRSTRNDGPGWYEMSGTSMASPHVAGGAALYLGRNPGAAPSAVRDGLIAAGTVGPFPRPLLYVRTD